MKKVGAPGGFTPVLKKLIDSAAKDGKQIGAPKLSKVIHGHGLHLGQLKKADQKQLRDLFENAPLTSKARALAEKILQGTTGGINSPGVKKVAADQPMTSGGGLGGVKKVAADQPMTTGGGGVVKVKADLPTTTTGGGLGGVNKVAADQPMTTGGGLGGVKKVKADESSF